MLVSSDWSHVWLRKHNKSCALGRAVNFVRLPGQPRWSNSTAQFSLLSFCTKERPLVCQNALEFLKINETLEKSHYTLHEDLPDEIREWIFIHVKDEPFDVEEHHASVPMDIKKCLAKLFEGYALPQATWSTKGQFDQVILTWHIATELSYYSDQKEGCSESQLPHFQASKLLSQYMFYLLVMCPSMLPIGIREIRLRDTSAEAFMFFEDHQILDSKSDREPYWWTKILASNRRKGNEPNLYLQQASRMLLEVSTEVLLSKVKGGQSKSVLFDGCGIVAAIREREISIKGETIGKLWIKILMYAASQQRGSSCWAAEARGRVSDPCLAHDGSFRPYRSFPDDPGPGHC